MCYHRGNWSAIISFSSDVAFAGQPGGALFATAKGAVLSWTRTIAYEWAIKYDIPCCVNPTMKTPMYLEYLDNLEEARVKFLAAERMKVPMRGEMGEVDRDIEPVMVFLSSDLMHQAILMGKLLRSMVNAI